MSNKVIITGMGAVSPIGLDVESSFAAAKEGKGGIAKTTTFDTEITQIFVAGEVKGLAHQTNEATHQIEQTVAEILATARQYEEAIGLIIKNVSAINKVSQDLGDLMTSPPPRVEPGAPKDLPNVTKSTPAAGPTLAAAMPPKEPDTDEVPEFDEMFAPEVEQDVSVEDAAIETASAIEDVAQEAKDILLRVMQFGRAPTQRGRGAVFSHRI